MVGTDSKDYGVAQKAVGPLSDGLVMMRNAFVQGAPRAFVHRAHSGHYGIVNSESSYQNMVRFLFGDTRVDGILEVESISLPPKVQKDLDDNKKVKASYHFEVVVRVRGARWELHRRTVTANSAIFRTFQDIAGPNRRNPWLFSAFLDRRAAVSGRRSLGFSIDLGVLIPEYEIENAWWLNDHYDGGYLYRDKINLEVTPPRGEGLWRLRYGFDSRTPNRASRTLDGNVVGDHLIFRIPIESSTRPGLKAVLTLRCRGWNK
jgi:hypothetical protein